jgi:uncharacterized DUF497 family protein
MYSFVWNEEKNTYLKNNRSVSFEDVINAINDGRLLEICYNQKKNYKNQQLIIVWINNYTYVIPCIISGNEIFLKTIYPSRVFMNKYKELLYANK